MFNCTSSDDYDALPLQPNSSSLIDIWLCQAVGRMRMYCALTAVDSSWETTVLRSLFAANSFKRTQGQSVRHFTKVSMVHRSCSKEMRFQLHCLSKKAQEVKSSTIFSNQWVYWWADLRYTLSWLLVVIEVYTIVTVLQLVLGDPLIEISSSLAGEASHFNVLDAQINLKPLIAIIVARWPWPCFAMTSWEV